MILSEQFPSFGFISFSMLLIGVPDSVVPPLSALTRFRSTIGVDNVVPLLHKPTHSRCTVSVENSQYSEYKRCHMTAMTISTADMTKKFKIKSQ